MYVYIIMGSILSFKVRFVLKKPRVDKNKMFCFCFFFFISNTILSKKYNYSMLKFNYPCILIARPPNILR